jgi:acid stress-induced BolA-like protein IbaG/YrbA
MSFHMTTFEGSVTEALRKAIQSKIEDAEVEATGSGGHFSLVVRSAAFAGKGMLQRHRLVMAAIAPLMEGDAAPVHAVDSLQTLPK